MVQNRHGLENDASKEVQCGLEALKQAISCIPRLSVTWYCGSRSSNMMLCGHVAQRP